MKNMITKFKIFLLAISSLLVMPGCIGYVDYYGPPVIYTPYYYYRPPHMLGPVYYSPYRGFRPYYYCR